MPNQSVSIKLTPDDYTVSFIGIHVTGHGHTEAAAWNDFWTTYHAQWKPRTKLVSANGLPPAPETPAHPHPARTPPLRLNQHLRRRGPVSRHTPQGRPP